MVPETRYARAGDVHIAYQVVGDGPIDLVYVPPQLQQVEHLWAEPRIAAFFERLARFSRLILFDRRGTGLSDPIASTTTLEDQMEDVTAVLDAVGSEQAALFAQAEGAAMAALYAATHPERVGDGERILAEVERFLTGTHTPPEPDRVLATVMFTDIVGSTETAARLGDRAWRELLARHDELSRAQLARFRGRAVKSLGDGFLATFDGPARAIRCALELRDEMRDLGVELRAGLHTGECEAMGDDVGGLAVHIGARVGALAAPREVLVSNTVKDLVVGSGIDFSDRGEHALKGVPGTWRLWAAGD